MKTTRRRLLSLIGLGAAAAALAPVKGVAAMESACKYCDGATRDYQISGNGIAAGMRACDACQRAWELWSVDQSAAIAQARADGYNRGREVEAARQEARRDDTDYLQGMIDRGEPIIGGHYYISRPLNVSMERPAVVRDVVITFNPRGAEQGDNP